MKTVKILKAFALALILSTLSCNTTDRHQALGGTPTIDTVRLARIGMNMQDVIARMGTPLPTDSPVFVYPAEGGGFYVFFFVATNEVSPLVRLQEFPALVAVAKYDKHPLGKSTHGTYLLPKEVEGRRCTGVRLAKQ